MTYPLYLGDFTYSSWSLRAWLLFAKFDIGFRQHLVDFSSGDVAGQLKDLAPARTVPAMVTPEGAVVTDSLAIAEELASRHPAAGLWPKDPAARAVARSISAEMHSGFGALRQDCPMNLRTAYSDYTPDDAVLADVARIDELWSRARGGFGADGPWLFGDFSIADAFYAPVAMRIAGYGLPVGDVARAYVDTHLSDRALRRWRAMGLARDGVLPQYKRDYSQTVWPGPAPLKAEPVADGPSENARCPYSGDPVTHYLQISGRVFGFCNAFCRDKTVADPEAWPDFIAIYQS